MNDDRLGNGYSIDEWVSIELITNISPMIKNLYVEAVGPMYGKEGSGMIEHVS